MLTLSSFPNMKLGQIHKKQSDFIMETTWNTDIASKEAYMYDFFHDKHIKQMIELEPEEDVDKTKVEIKFYRSASQTFEKDTVTFRIQFKPSFDYTETELSYYDDLYKNIYGSTFPIGMYIDIPNEKGVYNKWMVVGVANYYVNQFPTFEVLPVNYIVQYVIGNKKYEIPAVLRSQNSYNSGEWQDHSTRVVEDQQKFILPMNRETEKVYYNQRLLIDAMVKTEPRAWRISKINRISPTGVGVYTLAQDFYDQNKDYIELNENGDVVGLWADYYDSPVLPEDYSSATIDKYIKSEITYSGSKCELKVGGSYRTFTVKYYENDSEIDFESGGTWTYVLDGVDITTTVDNYVNMVNIDDSKFKMKFIDKYVDANGITISNQKYIGKILNIKYSSANSECDLDISIQGL